MSKQPGVMFTEPNEFVAEISRDHARGLVERGIVRVTKVGRPAMSGTITRVTVEAAAIVDSRCVPLRCVCGDLWGSATMSRCSSEQLSSSASSRTSWSTPGSSREPACTTTDPAPRPGRHTAPARS
jgi:hypothetical protein